MRRGRKEGRKEEINVLFNDALNTFSLRLYGVGSMRRERRKTVAKASAGGAMGRRIDPTGVTKDVVCAALFLYVEWCM